MAKAQTLFLFSDSAKERLLFHLRVFAPVYFIGFSVFRAYMETDRLALEPCFSYYRGLHFTAWFITAALVFVLGMHFFTGVRLHRLLFMLYGVTFLAVPMSLAHFTGTPMGVTYLTGSFKTIASTILTFCLLDPVNWLLGPEIVMLCIGLTIAAYYFTRNLFRSVMTALVSYLVNITLMAVHWFGPESLNVAVFPIETNLTIQPFQAVLYTHWATAIVIFAAWREGVFSNVLKPWDGPGAWGAGAWLAFVLAAWVNEWFVAGFDLLTSGLPFWTAGLLFGLARKAERTGLEGIPWRGIILACCLILQLLVMTPVYLGEQESFTGPAHTKWVLQPPGPTQSGP